MLASARSFGHPCWGAVVASLRIRACDFLCDTSCFSSLARCQVMAALLCPTVVVVDRRHKGWITPSTCICVVRRFYALAHPARQARMCSKKALQCFCNACQTVLLDKNFASVQPLMYRSAKFSISTAADSNIRLFLLYIQQFKRAAHGERAEALQLIDCTSSRAFFASGF